MARRREHCELRGILAIFNLHDWTAKLMRGEIDVEFPGF